MNVLYCSLKTKWTDSNKGRETYEFICDVSFVRNHQNFGFDGNSDCCYGIWGRVTRTVDVSWIGQNFVSFSRNSRTFGRCDEFVLEVITRRIQILNRSDPEKSQLLVFVCIVSFIRNSRTFGRFDEFALQVITRRIQIFNRNDTAIMNMSLVETFSQCLLNLRYFFSILYNAFCSFCPSTPALLGRRELFNVTLEAVELPQYHPSPQLLFVLSFPF